MQKKFEKFKARRKRIKKAAGLGIKYSTLNNNEPEENITHKTKPKRSKSEGKTKAKKQKLMQQTDSVCLANSPVIKSTNQMMNLDLRPLVVEIFD